MAMIELSELNRLAGVARALIGGDNSMSISPDLYLGLIARLEAAEDALAQYADENNWSDCAGDSAYMNEWMLREDGYAIALAFMRTKEPTP